METTTNYGLKKPAQEDFVNVDDINYNSDILDEKIAELEETAEGALPAEDYTAEDILEKLKTVDGAGSGLDADLFKGQSVVPVANGGTGQTTSAGINRQVFGSTNNSGVTEFTDYKNLECGTYQFVYSALKENDPFTNTGNKRVSIAVFQGVSVNERVIIAASVDGGDAGRIFIGHRDSVTVDWYQVASANTLSEMMRTIFNGEGIGNVVVPVSAGGTGNTTGNAPSAAKLAVARTIQTNLAGTTAASFDGTANITPGVTGVLPISRGGTGVDSAEKINKLIFGTNVSQNSGFEDYADLDFGTYQFVYSAKKTNDPFPSESGSRRIQAIVIRGAGNSNERTIIAACVDGTDIGMTYIGYITDSSPEISWHRIDRGIKYSTTDLTAGTSTLANGNIYLVYE